MGRGCLEKGDFLESCCINFGYRWGVSNLGDSREIEGGRVKRCWRDGIENFLFYILKDKEFVIYVWYLFKRGGIDKSGDVFFLWWLLVSNGGDKKRDLWESKEECVKI